ncbi:MAG: ABC transporter permease [Thermoanaerobaculia bacterium]|nr:ABC transporter permease [Thermoanaerobaculia bacterium]
MIITLLRTAWLNLKRDRAALLLSFVLPLVFFSIFAGVFANVGGAGSLPAVEVVVVDEDGSEASRRLVAALLAEEGLKGPGKDNPHPIVVASRDEAREQVEKAACDAAVVVPAGFGASFGSGFGSSGRLLVYADTVANPIAHQIVDGLLQKTAMTAAPDLLIKNGLSLFERYGGELTEQQKGAVAQLDRQLGEGSGDAGRQHEGGLVGVEVEDVRRHDESRSRRQRMVAFQAAGIGVMFLLFSMSSAAGSLLEEESGGTLERLLGTGIGMGKILIGYWLFAALSGFAQVCLMFLWGWVVFGLDLWAPGHPQGFLLMTAMTAAAASAFGLVLGTACRSQAQLGAVSTIVVLVMSALGGSMFPRFLMRQNPVLDVAGLATFNGWAIDGYQKVFWYETGLLSLWPQVLVLLLVTVGGLGVARLLARRWEAI